MTDYKCRELNKQLKTHPVSFVREKIAMSTTIPTEILFYLMLRI